MEKQDDDLYYSFPNKLTFLVIQTYICFIFVLYLFYRFKSFIKVDDNIMISYPFSWGKEPCFISKKDVKNIIYDVESDFFLFDINGYYLEIDCKLWRPTTANTKTLSYVMSNKIKEWGLVESKPDFIDIEKYKQRFLFNHVSVIFFIGLSVILQTLSFEYTSYIFPSVEMLDKIVIMVSIIMACLTLLFYWFRESDGRIFESSYFSILILPFILSLCCAYAIPKYTVFNGHAKEYVYILVSSNESQQIWQSQGMDDLQIKRKYNNDYRDETIGAQRTVLIYQGWGDIKVIKESTANSFFQK
ncbi:hypothetical protein [Agitococcus lubricus]|nr:hypothetical protein [Agitococcus lubricus]